MKITTQYRVHRRISIQMIREPSNARSVHRLMSVVAGGLVEKYVKDALGAGNTRTQEGQQGRVLRLKDFSAHFIVFTMGVVLSSAWFCVKCSCRCSRSKESNPPVNLLASPLKTAFLAGATERRLRKRSADVLRVFSSGKQNQRFYQLH